MKKSLLFAVMMLLSTGAFAWAACTPEEAGAKAQEFMNAATALAQKDAQKYTEVAKAMQEQLPQLQQNVNDVDALCSFYDEWVAKMKQ